jgi:hypothetical protein
MNPKTYTLQFTGPGLDYVRQVLGQRPFDEVAGLLSNIEQQRRAQDEPAPPPAAPPMPDAPATPA